VKLIKNLKNDNNYLFLGINKIVMINKIHKMVKTMILISSMLLFSLSSIAQDLPIWMTKNEKVGLLDYMNSLDTKGITHPPSSKVRNMAEWEEVDKLFITWTSYTSVLKEIVRAARLECRVYIFCSDSNTVKTYLSNSPAVPLTNVSYFVAPYNSVWIRDYFANTVYTNDVDSLLLVDWVYNRNRPKDDTICRIAAKKFGIPLYQTTNAPYKLVHTGGNYMSDGFGNAFSEELIVDENARGGGFSQNLTEPEIDTIMKKFMGINRYTTLPNLPNDGIHHIDMHMKLLDEETLLIGQYPAGTSDGPQIEANLQYVLANVNSIFGTPYKVIRVVMPPDPGCGYPLTSNSCSYLTYSNGIFVNKTYILPTYYAQYDTTAVRILKQSMPGYNIVSVNCNLPIAASGAIHCIAHTMGSSEPLLISHQSLTDTYNSTTPYAVNARIQTKSGVNSAEVFYRTDTTQPYISTNMTLTSIQNNTWTGNIPAQAFGKTVYYYIHAKANSLKEQVRPITAPLGYWKFSVLGTSGIDNNTEQKVSLNEIYPNPAKSITCIPVESSLAIKASINLYDVLGRHTQKIFEGVVPEGKSNYFIDASKLASGTYIVKFISDKYCSNQMLIVK
jgi:agmatine/peptidylarginine deiminase